MASVIKRRWKKPDGSIGEAWAVRFVDHRGVRRSKTFTRKKDADKYRVGREAEKVERGFATFVEDKTVDHVSREYLNAQEHRMEDGRIGRGRFESILMAFRRSIVPRLGKVILSELTVADVERFYRELRSADKLTAITSKNRVQEMKLLCDFGIKYGYCKENVAQKALHDMRGVPSAKVKTFSPDDVGTLLRAANVRFHGQHERSFALIRLNVHLAAFCGLRWGEIFGLSLGSVRFDKQVLEIRRSITEWDELKGPKTAAGVRDVPMPTHVAELLRDWIDRFHFPNDRDLIFRVGKPERPTMLSAANFHVCHWRKLLDRAGLACPGNQFHFHALRHFAASWWIMNGLPLTDTASLMGHSKVDMTLQVYAHGLIGGSARSQALNRMSTTLLEAAEPRLTGGATIDHIGSMVTHSP